MAELRFYLDENLPVAIAEQLKQRGIEAVTVRDLGLLGDADQNHLDRTARLGYVLCPYDTDFVPLANTGVKHCGIIIGQPEKHWIGEWVKGLTLYHTVHVADDLHNQVQYL